MLIIVELLLVLFNILLPVLKALSVIVTFPVFLLHGILETNLFNRPCNLLSLYTSLFVHLCFIAVLTNFHYIIAIYYFGGITGYLKLILIFGAINFFHYLMYILSTEVYTRNFLRPFNGIVEILYVSIIIALYFPFFFICFDLRYMPFFFFDFNAMLCIAFLELIYGAIGIAFVNCLILIHLINPISLLRVLTFTIKFGRYGNTECFLTSIGLIPKDFIILLQICCNIILSPIQIIKFTFNFSSYSIDEYSDEIKCNDRIFSDCEFFIKLKYFNKNLFIKNLKFYGVIVIVLFCSMMVWRIPKVLSLAFNYFKNEDFNSFIKNIEIIIVNDIYNINYIIMKIMIYVNYPSYLFYRALCLNNQKFNLSDYELLLFTLKNSPRNLLITFLLFTRMFIPTFYIGKFTHLKNRGIIEFMFPILKKRDILIEKSNNINDFENDLIKLRNHHYKKILYDLLSLIAYILIFFHIIIHAIFFPFLGYKFFMMFKYLNANINSTTRLENIIFEFLKILSIHFFAVLIGLLSIFILTILAPWNIYYVIIFYIESFNIFSKDIRKVFFNFDELRNIVEYKPIFSLNLSYIIKHNNKEYDTFKYTSEEFNAIFKNNTKIDFIEFIKFLFVVLVDGYKLIFKFTFLHLISLNMFRLVSLYIDLFSIIYQKDVDEISILSIISLNNKPNILLSRKLNKNSSLTLESGYIKLYLNLLHSHFELAIKEFVFSPFILIFTIIAPWNINEITDFLSLKDFNSKLNHFWSLTKKTFIDLFVATGVVFLLLSVTYTIETFKLLNLTFRKKIFKTDYDIDQYNIHFKYGFDEHIILLFKKLLKRLFSFILLIINFLLILRIPSLIRRLTPIIRSMIISDVMNFKKYIYKDENKKEGKKLLIKCSNTVIFKISEFMIPKDLINLSLVNKVLNNKVNSNSVWGFQADNYYIKKLSNRVRNTENNEGRDIQNIIVNKDNFSHNKQLCKRLNGFLKKTDVMLNESERDSLIGFDSVIIEEFIESLLKIPHLILLPFKATYLIFNYIEALLKILISIINRIPFPYFKLPLKDYDTIRQFEENAKTFINFYDIQIVIAKTVLKIFLLIISIPLNLFLTPIINFVLFSCFVRVINDQNNLDIRDRDADLVIRRRPSPGNLISKFIQKLYSLLTLISFWIIFTKLIQFLFPISYERLFIISENNLKEFCKCFNDANICSNFKMSINNIDNADNFDSADIEKCKIDNNYNTLLNLVSLLSSFGIPSGISMIFFHIINIGHTILNKPFSWYISTLKFKGFTFFGIYYILNKIFHVIDEAIIQKYGIYLHQFRKPFTYLNFLSGYTYLNIFFPHIAVMTNDNFKQFPSLFVNLYSSIITLLPLYFFFFKISWTITIFLLGGFYIIVSLILVANLGR